MSSDNQGAASCAFVLVLIAMIIYSMGVAVGRMVR